LNGKSVPSSALTDFDMVSDSARLDVLIDTARAFRSQNPQAPKKAAELAVDEILRLRRLETNLRTDKERLFREIVHLERCVRDLHTGAQQLRDRQFKSRWFRIGLRLGFYY
jgi:hypothetical protein